MKPGDHPEFFRFQAPEGRSRESTIRLDGDGNFWHEENLVEHSGLATAMHTWVRRHPEDGRFILSNGYDWTYFKVEDAPLFVRGVRAADGGLVLALSDATEELWDPSTTRIAESGALYASVKRNADGGPFEAKFTRHAQTALAPWLTEIGGQAAVKIGEHVTTIGVPSPQHAPSHR